MSKGPWKNKKYKNGRACISFCLDPEIKEKIIEEHGSAAKFGKIVLELMGYTEKEEEDDKRAS